MAETAGSLRTALLRRVRDPAGTAHTSERVFAVLSHCQRLVNGATRAILVEQVAPIGPKFPFISLSVSFPTCLRMEAVRIEDHDLDLINWHDLQHLNPRWFRAVADRPRVWSPIGRYFVLVWPSPRVSTTVTLVGTQMTPALTISTDIVVLPDQHIPALLALAEQVLLMRQRLFESMKAVAKRSPETLTHGTPF